MNEKQYTPYNILLFATYIFYVLMYIEDTLPVGQVFTLAAILIMLASYARMSEGQFHIPMAGFLIYIAVFLVYCILSMRWAEMPMRTFSMVKAVFMILILMTATYICHYRRTRIEDLLSIIMYGGYTVVIYAFLRYGVSRVLSSLGEQSRISNGLLNANVLGMCAAYAIVINFWRVIYEKIRWTDILALPAVVMLAASESRKAILIVGAGVCGVLIFKNLDPRQGAASFVKIAIGMVALAVIFLVLLQTPAFAGLRGRLNSMLRLLNGSYTRYTSGYARLLYMQIGIKLFKQHPLLGIGIFSAGKYIERYAGHPHLHNNFVELLACGGLVGFLIYYSIYGYVAVMFWKLRRLRDSVYDICLILFAIRLVMGFGHIQYNSAATYFFLMVFILEIRELKGAACVR